MESAGRLLGRMKGASSLVTAEDIARRAWPRAVGKTIAKRTEAVALVRNTLVIEVEDALWQRQLNGLRHTILANIREAVGNGIVEDLDFRPMGARRAPQKAEQASSLHRADDEAAKIADPVLRRLYIVSRRKATA